MESGPDEEDEIKLLQASVSFASKTSSFIPTTTFRTAAIATPRSSPVKPVLEGPAPLTTFLRPQAPSPMKSTHPVTTTAVGVSSVTPPPLPLSAPPRSSTGAKEVVSHLQLPPIHTQATREEAKKALTKRKMLPPGQRQLTATEIETKEIETRKGIQRALRTLDNTKKTEKQIAERKERLKGEMELLKEEVYDALVENGAEAVAYGHWSFVLGEKPKHSLQPSDQSSTSGLVQPSPSKKPKKAHTVDYRDVLILVENLYGKESMERVWKEIDLAHKKKYEGQYVLTLRKK